MPAKTSMYGMPKAQRSPYKITSVNLNKNDPNGTLIEFPLMVTKFLGKTIPAAGGFYLRFFPYWYMKLGIFPINGILCVAIGISINFPSLSS